MLARGNDAPDQVEVLKLFVRLLNESQEGRRRSSGRAEPVARRLVQEMRMKTNSTRRVADGSRGDGRHRGEVKGVLEGEVVGEER